VSQGHFAEAVPYLVQAITLLEETPDRWEWFDSVGCLGITLAMRGQVAAGLAEGQRPLARMEATKNHFGIAQGHTWLLPIYLEQGDMSRLLEESERAVEVAIKSDMAVHVSVGLGFKALAQSRLGQHEDAAKSMVAALDVGARVGGRFMLSDWIAAANAELAYHADRWEEAIALAEQVAAMAQSFGGIFAEGWAHRVWAQALTKSQPACWDQAEAHLAASLRLFEEGEARLEAAHTRVAWGKILRERGERSAAREHFEKAAAQFLASGLTQEMDDTQRLLADMQ
jgi:tetratricopeptide (TPR) repeat protein